MHLWGLGEPSQAAPLQRSRRVYHCCATCEDFPHLRLLPLQLLLQRLMLLPQQRQHQQQNGHTSSVCGVDPVGQGRLMHFTSVSKHQQVCLLLALRVLLASQLLRVLLALQVLLLLQAQHRQQEGRPLVQEEEGGSSEEGGLTSLH